ncbi:MAG TPA: FAD/NAD(P)-binding oxidoreductase [Gemmatimonadaceae bacterium]|nr:FAD/NAD(P)-binding oxidoreductase [Gemmatimonadaceae bacterium]
MIDGALCGMGTCFQCVPRRACMERVPQWAGAGHPADVMIVGAGPAGIAAAVHAAEAGRRVVVLDSAQRPGGQIWRHRDRRTLPRVAVRWLERFDRCGAEFVPGAEVVDASPFGGRTVVLATGARERYLPFPGWTLPGVIGIGGAQALLKNGAAEFAGRRVVLAGSGPLMLTVAAALARAGARIVLVAEQASARRMTRFATGLWRTPGRILDAIAYRSAFVGAPFRPGTWVTRVSVSPSGLDVMLSDGQRVASDVLCTGYGLVPSTELARLAGCTIRDGAVDVDERQATSVRGIFCAGEPTGIGGVDAALVEGAIAGRAAAGVALSRDLTATRARHREFAQRLDAAFAIRPEVRSLAEAETIVCRCEGVPYGALDPAWTPRQAKLYTRIGMGPCQGRVCGPIMECLRGWPPDTPRPPIFPTPVRAFL